MQGKGEVHTYWLLGHADDALENASIPSEVAV